jgi:hypothetical protein
LAQSSKFPTDLSKCLATTQFLRGNAYKYIQPLLQTEPMSPLLQDYEAFLTELQIMFGDPNELQTCARLITDLRQHTSVPTYISEFTRLSAPLQWDNNALVYHFYRGLKEEIKDELSRVDRPTELQALMTIATRIDHRLQERRLERTPRPPPPRSFVPPSSRSKLPATMVPPPLPAPATSPSSATPMDLGSARAPYRKLTPQEWQYRVDNKLCLYCGQPGHVANDCPIKNSRPIRAAAAYLPPTTPPLALPAPPPSKPPPPTTAIITPPPETPSSHSENYTTQ